MDFDPYWEEFNNNLDFIGNCSSTVVEPTEYFVKNIIMLLMWEKAEVYELLA